MKKIITLLTLILCFAGQLHASENPSGKTEGDVVIADKKLAIIDALATWNPKEKEMVIYMYPFKLTTSDKQKIMDGKGWEVGLFNESPDTKQWDSWSPNTRVSIKFSQSKNSLDSAIFSNFMFYGLEKKNDTANLNFSGKQVQDAINELVTKENTLAFKSNSSGKVFDKKYSWNLSTSCPIVEIQ